MIDVLNSPDFSDGPVMNFFTTSTTNLVAAAKKAGVGHYVALSIVGIDGLPESGYLRAKVAQEKIITESGLPYTLVRATQFAEFTDQITDSLVVGDEVHVPDALIQPIKADQVAADVARAAVAAPLNDFVNIGGPEEDLVRADGTRLAGAPRRHHGRRRRHEGQVLRHDARGAQPGDAYLISASTVPCVIAAPASTARPVMVPSLWAVTGFSIFIASSTTTRSPAATS